MASVSVIDSPNDTGNKAAAHIPNHREINFAAKLKPALNHPPCC